MVVALQEVRRQSVQQLPDAKSDTLTTLVLEPWLAQRGPLLESWGTRKREEQLRTFYRHDYNWMIQGAFAGIMKLIGSTPWEIDGPDGGQFGIDYWQALIRGADFGRGWGSFLMKGVDYLRHDGGWYWEIIAPGTPTRPPSGAATGIAHLDSLRCIPTGDPEFPVIYVDKQQKLHRMHHTRVVQLVDMPDGDEKHPGYGLCALSRAVAIAHREIYMGRYVQANLDDLPAPGIVTASGMNKDKRDQALTIYREEQSTDQMPPWGRQLWFFGMDRDSTPELNTYTFQTPPEKFDFKTYTELDVDALALAIGVDRQDLWQLTGGNIGSGTQSEVLAQKSRGKTIGYLRTAIERAMNDILPEEYEFSFKYRDGQEDQERALVAKTWSDAVMSASPHLDDLEARRILADVVEPFGEVLRDESGEVIERDDADVKPQGQTEDVTQPDNQQTTQPSGGAAPAQPAPRSNPALAGRRDFAMDRVAEKQYQATRLDFEAAFSDLITGAVKGDVGRVRFRVVARALMRTYGRDAWLDGLREGGATVDTLEGDDQVDYSFWLAKQSEYVSNLEARIYREKVKVNPDSTADMWANKSLQEAYYGGLQSADRNGMYVFAGEDGMESCPTCKRLKGQRHRMKDWVRRQLRPGVDIENFKCGGWHCNHTLAPTHERAFGRF